MVNPCHNCTERFIACHDNCPKDARGEYGYAAWKADREAEKKFNRENGYFIHRAKSPARKKAKDQYLKDRRRGRK